MTIYNGVVIPTRNIRADGDSITWLGLYEQIIASALASGPGTSNLKSRLINQGVDGGTVKDLGTSLLRDSLSAFPDRVTCLPPHAVRGYSPWGHLDPFVPQTNITFAQTLARDHPDVVGVQIGINDVWQAGPGCGDRCSNVSEFVRVLAQDIIAPARALGARVYLASVSTIGEKANGSNPLDSQVRQACSSQQQWGRARELARMRRRSVCAARRVCCGRRSARLDSGPAISGPAPR